MDIGDFPFSNGVNSKLIALVVAEKNTSKVQNYDMILVFFILFIKREVQCAKY